MNCGNGAPHPAHSFEHPRFGMQVCLGVPEPRWGSGR